MALNVSNLSSSGPSFISSILNSIPEQVSSKFSLLLDIGKILLIIIIIYFVIKIIAHLLKVRDSGNLSKISKQVSEINEKMSLLLDKKQKKEKHK